MRYHIIRLAKGGTGVSRETGKTFFVEGALPGESGEAEIVEEKERYGICRAVTRESDASCRIKKDACPCSDACGGCGFRHVRPEFALELKAGAVFSEIQKAAHLPDMPYELVPLLGCELDGTRRRIRLHTANGKTGYFARSSHQIISASECVVIDPHLRPAIVWLQNAFRDFRDAQLDIQIDLDDQNRVFAHIKAVEPRILKKYQHRPGMKKPLSSAFDMKRLASVAEDGVRQGIFAGIRAGDTTYGEPWIRDVVTAGGVRTVTWRRIGDFAQATSQANAHIHGLVNEFLAYYQPRYAADLYCGSGNLTFRAAVGVSRVEGFEFFCDSEAFEKGVLDNEGVFPPGGTCRLTKSDLSRGLPSSAGTADVMICDPARDGLSEQIAADICHSLSRAILYVSCEASCLARDLVRLQKSFAVKKMWFVDMFPQTPHVETVAWLERCSRSPEKDSTEL